jgi:hypothetical protein
VFWLLDTLYYWYYTALFSYSETSHTLTFWSVPKHWRSFTIWPVTSPSTDEILLPATYGSNLSDKAHFCHFLLENCLCRSWKLANRNTKAKKRCKVDYEAHTRTEVLKHESHLHKNVNIVTCVCNIRIYKTTNFFFQDTHL